MGYVYPDSDSTNLSKHLFLNSNIQLSLQIDIRDGFTFVWKTNFVEWFQFRWGALLDLVKYFTYKFSEK